jgi:hypothetical protein
LTQVGDFSPSVDSGAILGHYNVLKSSFLVMNLIIESKVLSKSDLEIEIGQLCAEILTDHKTSATQVSLWDQSVIKFIAIKYN